MIKTQLFEEHLGEGVEVTILDGVTQNSLEMDETGYIGRFRPVQISSLQILAKQHFEKGSKKILKKVKANQDVGEAKKEVLPELAALEQLAKAASHPLVLEVRIPVRKDEKVFMWNIKNKSRKADGLYWISGKRKGDFIVFRKTINLQPGKGEWKDVFITTHPQNYMRFLRVKKNGQVTSGNIGIVTQMRDTYVRAETMYELQVFKNLKEKLRIPEMRTERQHYVNFWLQKIYGNVDAKKLPGLNTFRKKNGYLDLGKLGKNKAYVQFYSELEGCGVLVTNDRKQPGRRLNLKVHFSNIEPDESGFATLKGAQRASFTGVQKIEKRQGKLGLQAVGVEVKKR